jgi:glycosyltransferase involved in cell wall biosynthesis
VYDSFMKQGKRPNASKVTIVSNALEMECADRSAVPERAATGGFVFGFIGRFSKPKGLIPFLSKIIENRDLLDDARLVLVGDGEDMETLRRMVTGNDLTRQIVFEGNRDNVLDYMRGFDVLVLPSISEGLPMVILEAMSMGKPVLAFDVGSVAEALRNGVNGYLVEAGDYDAFIRHMRRLKDSKEELVTLGKNGRALLVSEFGMERYMGKIEELYRSLYRNEDREGPPY